METDYERRRQSNRDKQMESSTKRDSYYKQRDRKIEKKYKEAENNDLLERLYITIYIIVKFLYIEVPRLLNMM